MSVKILYTLPTAFFANNLITDTSSTELNRIIQKNLTDNSNNLRKNEILWNSRKDFSDSNLLLPVNLLIFDKYYKNLSEWKYWDKYSFSDDVLVFDKRLYNSPEYKDSYKKIWLNNLKHLKNFEYYKTSDYQYQYHEKDESFHVNWIDGKDSGHNLKNILSLNLPKKVDQPFEMHDKIVQLDHSYKMDSKINLYSGYWKNGQLNKRNNIISKIEYGNLKLKPKNEMIYTIIFLKKK